MSQNLLEVNNLVTYFYRHDGIVKAVDGISFALKESESLAIVGESGSGKSVSMLSLLGLIKPPGKVMKGEALFQEKDLLRLNKEELRGIRGKEISMIFQDPMSSLNPTMTVGRQIMEAMLWHGYRDKRFVKRRAIEILDQVGIPSAQERFKEYPFQFSGGMRQRVMIAMAMVCEPKLIIADEPTTALDVTVQAQILDLLSEMKERLNTAIILVTHDFGVAIRLCERVQVMYAGKIVETASTREFINKPLHPYSRGLLASVPRLKKREKLKSIEGSPPNLISPPQGCRFHPRCQYALNICKNESPGLKEISPGHSVACFLYEGGGSGA